MNLIFSADNNWGIGKDNGLLFRTPGDMAFFKEKTLGRAVIMGRKTLESLPGGRPLPGRDNIVLTRDPDYQKDGVAVCRTLPELFALLADVADDDIFVIGGEQVYRQLMPYAGRAYITRWQCEAEADCRVPDFDLAEGWRLAERCAPMEEKGVTYCFCIYEQASPQPWRPTEDLRGLNETI